MEKIHCSTAFLNPPIKCFFDGSRLLPVVMPAIIQDGICAFMPDIFSPPKEFITGDEMVYTFDSDSRIFMIFVGITADCPA